MVDICITQVATASGAGVHLDVTVLPDVILRHGYSISEGGVPPKPLQVLLKFRAEGNVSCGWTLSEGSEHLI